MALSTDTLLFSIVMMLMAVQIEASGYGSSDLWVLLGLTTGAFGLLGSLASALQTVDEATTGSD
ncbi:MULTISPECIES: hypothetical protein [Salinibaculum]|uniref:hypothetical protein n=1 Tax=Salinibaculum TaxID=2732368 RepID=UPI0030CF7F47